MAEEQAKARDLSELEEADEREEDTASEEEQTEEADEAGEEEETEDEEASEEEEATKPVIDKRLQQEQQLRANAERRIALLQQQLEELHAKQQKIDDEDLDEDPMEVIKQIKEKMRQYDAALAEVNALRAKQTYDTFLNECNEEFGEDLQNDAIAYAREQAIKAGYSLQPGDVPDVQTTCALIREGYLRVALERERRKDGSGKESRTRSARVDTGRRGSGASSAKPVKGSVEAVKAAMLAENKFDNILTET